MRDANVVNEEESGKDFFRIPPDALVRQRKSVRFTRGITQTRVPAY